MATCATRDQRPCHPPLRTPSCSRWRTTPTRHAPHCRHRRLFRQPRLSVRQSRHQRSHVARARRRLVGEAPRQAGARRGPGQAVCRGRPDGVGPRRRLLEVAAHPSGPGPAARSRARLRRAPCGVHDRPTHQATRPPAREGHRGDRASTGRRGMLRHVGLTCRATCRSVSRWSQRVCGMCGMFSNLGLGRGLFSGRRKEESAGRREGPQTCRNMNNTSILECGMFCGMSACLGPLSPAGSPGHVPGLADHRPSC